MTRIVVALAVAATLFHLPSAGAQEDPDLEALIRDLGSNDWSVRDQAARRLAEIGFPARGALLAASEDADPEISRAAGSILARMDQTFLSGILAREDGFRVILCLNLGLPEDADPVDRLGDPTPEVAAVVQEALRSAGPSDGTILLALHLYDRAADEARAGYLEILLTFAAASPDDLVSGLPAFGPSARTILSDLLQAAADPQRPYPSPGLLTALGRAAIAAGDAEARLAAVDLVVGLGDPAHLSLLDAISTAGGGAGLDLVAARAYLGEAESLEHGLESFESIEEVAVRTRLIEALVLSPTRALPEAVLRAALDPAREDWTWAAAAAARLGTSEDRERVLEVARKVEDEARSGFLERLLDRAPDDRSFPVLPIVYRADAPRPVHLAALAILSDRASPSAWRHLASSLAQGEVPFVSLEAAWPRRIARLAGERGVPFLEAVAGSADWLDNRVRAAAFRSLVEELPELAGPAVRQVAANPFDPLAEFEWDAILDWASRTRGSTACRVVGDLLASAGRMDPARQRRAFGLLAEIGGDQAVAEIEIFLRSSYLEMHDEKVVLQAIRTCRTLGGPLAYGALLTLAGRTDTLGPAVLVEALPALAALGPREATTVPMLASAASSYEPAVQRAAVDSLIDLARKRPDARDAALVALESMTPEDDEHAAWIASATIRLAELSGPEDVEGWILFAAGASETPARFEAIRWLSELPRPHFARALWDVVLLADDPEVAGQALAALREKTGLDLPEAAAGPEGDAPAARRGTAMLEEWLPK